MPDPFTVPHFRTWASHLILDNDKPWTVEKFQADFVRDLFAGTPENWLIVPEGNAKTTLAAGISLYHAQFKPRARIPVAASSRDQAEWLYQAAAGFVERSEPLARLFRCQEGYRRIRCDSVGSRIQIFAADDRTGDGVIPTLCILEELHRHRNMNLYRTWSGKLLKRGGQLAAISTAGDPTGEFEETRTRIRDAATHVTRRGSYARLAGRRIVVHEYAVPEGASVENMTEVKKANPLKAITRTALRDKHDSPTMTDSHWRRFACGQPSTGTESPITPEIWDALRADIGCVEDGDTVTLAPIVVGGRGAIGIASARPDGKVAVRAEHLDAAPGRSIYAIVEDTIRALHGRYEVSQTLGPRYGLVRTMELVEDSGFPVEDHPYSTPRQIEATGTFERYLRSRELVHDGDPITRAHALAAVKKTGVMGDHYLASAETQAIVAIAQAVHAASAPTEDLRIILPSGVG